MGENINVIFESLVAAIIMIIFPLYSAYTSKDDISYALAMSYTKDFVDTIAENGYITEDMYREFATNLKNGTDNSYEVTLTHKSLRYDVSSKTVPTDEAPTVTVSSDWEIYDDNYIKNVMYNSSNKIYLLSEDDQISVSIKNVNTTLATIIFNIITANSSNVNTRIYVNLTSNVRNEAWRDFDNVVSIYQDVLEQGLETD